MAGMPHHKAIIMTLASSVNMPTSFAKASDQVRQPGHNKSMASMAWSTLAERTVIPLANVLHLSAS